jgi:hypothetical protein
MNEQERKIFFQLLIDLFLDGKQQESKPASDKQQPEGESRESISTQERKRTRTSSH